MVAIGLSTKGIEFDWKEGGNPIKEPPKGLEPAGDSGWYHSPEVVDPRDCRFYPDSPWCGGNPIDPSFGVQVEINVDNCGFTFTESGSALIKTPQFTQTYRYPGACRREYEKPPDVVPPPPMPGDFSRPPDTPIPQGFGADEYVAVAITEHAYGYERRWRVNEGAYAVSTYELSWLSGNVQCPSNYLFNGSPYSNYGALQPASSSVDFTYQYSNNPDSLWTAAYGTTPTSGGSSSITYAIDSRQGNAIDYSTTPPTQNNFKKAVHNPNSQGAELYEGRFGDIFKTSSIPTYYYESTNEGTDSLGRRYQNEIIDIKVYSIAYCIRKKDNFRNPPSLPPEPRNCDCMQCCVSSPQTQSQQNNDELLRQILAECKKANQRIGSDLFPATFPARLTGDNPGNVTLNNLAEMFKQQVIYSDELLGQYPVKIKIEDTDPTQSGNQSQTLEFQNTSEILAESFGAMMNVSIDTQILVQLATKALIELGVTRRQLHTTQSMLDALCQHVGFTSEEKTEDVPFTFTVPQSNDINNFKLEDFCKESTQKIDVIRYKGKTTIAETEAIVRHMHGIVKAAFWRGVAKDAVDVAGAIKNIVKKQSDTMDKIAVGTTDDLEDWAEDFERGFSGYSGGTTTRDPSKPYGLPLDQRPRVQIIRKPTSEPPTT